MGGGISNIMLNKQSHLYTIDDVFDPKSKFWKKIYHDMKSHTEDISSGTFDLGAESYKDRIADFIDYFKSASKGDSKQILKDIENTEEIVVDVLWNLLSSTDKELLFHNNIEYFEDWMDTCPQPLLDIYINKLAKGESLTNLKIVGKINEPKLKEKVNNIPKPEGCKVKISNGKLILCSTDHTNLKKITKIMINHGNLVEAYKEELLETDLTMHSYIFQIKKTK